MVFGSRVTLVLVLYVASACFQPTIQYDFHHIVVGERRAVRSWMNRCQPSVLQRSDVVMSQKLA